MTDIKLIPAQERLLAAISNGEVFYRPGRGNHVWDHHKPEKGRPSTVTTRVNGLVYRKFVEAPKQRASGRGRLTDAGEQYLASCREEREREHGSPQDH